MNKKIGFVGFGTMGLPMVINLNKAGFEVIGYDAFNGSCERAKAAGITVAATLKEVAEQTDDATVSMVRDYNQNVETLLGEDGLLSVDPRGLTIIVMNTLDPGSVNTLGQQVEAAADVKLIAAAVNGGATEARAGTLSIMAPDPEDRVNAVRLYFDTIGSNTFYYGTNPGNSQAAELVNNMVLDIVMDGVTEGLKFDEHYNLPREVLLNLLKASTGDSWVARNWSSISEWTKGTALAVLLKDLEAVHLEDLGHGIMIPFNTLSSTTLSDPWGQKPEAKRA